VVQGILNTPITLPLCEILGTSKEISQTLQDTIKLKNKPPIASINHASTFPGLGIYGKNGLITLRMTYQGVPITAIIDTGSQLNVIREEIAYLLQLPIDRTGKITMNDANGGVGKLEGLVKDVELQCGAYTSLADLYIGQTVPFDLLLGRPWQRGNLVSIDERGDGTFLIFKEPQARRILFDVSVALEPSSL